MIVLTVQDVDAKLSRKKGKGRILMLSYNLNSMKAAECLIRLCEKYRDTIEVDVIHGRQTIDGASMLGVYSLIGNIVSLDLHAKDEGTIQRFATELERGI